MIFSLDERRPEISDDAAFIADSATIIGSVEIAAEASVWFGAVLRGDNDWIRVGRGSNVQDGSILHTDAGIELRVGDNVTVGHRVMLHGCEIGDNALVGIGSIVLNHAKVGANTVVGANSLITEGKVFPDGVLLVGAPATVKRELSDDEIARLRHSAIAYQRNGRRYRDELALIVN